MNEWKPLLPFGGSTIIQTVAATALEVCRRVVLVVGYRGDDLADLFDPQPLVKVVRNPSWETGMLSSVQTGVRLIDTKSFFIVPGDMPYLSGGVYQALIDAAPADPVAPEYGGRRGHPVLVSSRLTGKILAAGPERSSMREILAGENFSVIPWSDDSILRDIDTPEDYSREYEG